MSENLTTNVELDSTANGTVSFATDVVATIAGMAAAEVEGVAAMINNGNMGLVDMLRKNQGNRPLMRGVKVDINGNQVKVQLTVTVDYGSPVPQVAHEIQDNVKKAIETMTGLEVPEINIYVQGISFEKENREAAELEQKQRAALNAQRVERLGKGEEAHAEDRPEDASESESRKLFRRAADTFAQKLQSSEKPAASEVRPEPDARQEANTASEDDAPASADDETKADSGDAMPLDEAHSTIAEAENAADDAEADAIFDDADMLCDGRCDKCTLNCEAAGRYAEADGAEIAPPDAEDADREKNDPE